MPGLDLVLQSILINLPDRITKCQMLELAKSYDKAFHQRGRETDLAAKRSTANK